MSSVDLSKSEIRRFLKSALPEVLCISGEWGVGKTFTWEKLLGEATEQNATELKRYAYISLFGQTSLEMLKQSIFENTEFLVSDDQEFKRQAKAFGNTALEGLKKGRGLLAAIPYVGQSLEKVISASNSALFSTVRNQIICIDDIERRGAGLRVKDVLGIVSFLKEQRQCKIVILLNESKLGDEREDFIDQTEKVIDSFIRFAPSAKEATEIALDGSDKNASMIADRCIRLDISNIRIIKRICRLVEMATSSLQTQESIVHEQVVSTIALLAWSRFDPKKAPPLEFIRGGLSNRLFADTESKPLSEQETSWNGMLRDYKFHGMDDLDNELQTGIENGFFDQDRLAKLSQEKEEEIKKDEGERQLWKAWDLVKHTLRDNTDEVVTAMRDAAKSGGKISLANLNSAISFVRSLGREADADLMIQDVVSKDEPPGYWNLSGSMVPTELTDPKLRDAVTKKLEDCKIEEPLEDVLARVGSRNGWSTDDIKRLSAADENEVESLIRDAEGERFDKILAGLLVFMKISNPLPDMAKVNQIAEAVLRRFASGSTINRLRVDAYLKGA